jgi:hypothetical protein
MAGVFYVQVQINQEYKDMNLLEAKRELRACGMTIRRRDGEYRVNFVGDCEALAYYTNDIEDAVATAKLMAEAMR